MENEFFKKYETFSSIFEHFLKLKDDEALKFFNEYVDNIAKVNNLDIDKAINCGKRNFGYWSGYYSFKVQERTQRILDCEHPIFGKVEDYKDKDADFFFNKGVEQAINRVYETNR